MITYKVITRIIVTNIMLFYIGVTKNDVCTRCSNAKDTIEHRFWDCSEVMLFWRHVSRWLSRSQGSSQNAITKKMLLLGNGGTKND